MNITYFTKFLSLSLLLASFQAFALKPCIAQKKAKPNWSCRSFTSTASEDEKSLAEKCENGTIAKFRYGSLTYWRCDPRPERDAILQVAQAVSTTSLLNYSISPAEASLSRSLPHYFTVDALAWAQEHHLNVAEELTKYSINADTLKFLIRDLEVRRQTKNLSLKITRDDLAIAQKYLKFPGYDSSFMYHRRSLYTALVEWPHTSLEEVFTLFERLHTPNSLARAFMVSNDSHVAPCMQTLKSFYPMNPALADLEQSLIFHQEIIDRFLGSCFDDPEVSNFLAKFLKLHHIIGPTAMTFYETKIDETISSSRATALGQRMDDFQNISDWENAIYQKGMFSAIFNVAAHLPQYDLSQSLETLGNSRSLVAQKIAFVDGIDFAPNDWRFFGALRGDIYTTRIWNQYESVRLNACSLAQKELKNTFTFTYNGFELTQIICDKNCVCRWIHTKPQTAFELIEKEARPVYDLIIKTTYPSEVQLYQDLAKLHWLLAHAMIYKRGSASIAEGLIQALILFHQKKSLPNLLLRPLKRNKLPDLEALITPNIYVYAKNYRSLYE